MWRVKAFEPTCAYLWNYAPINTHLWKYYSLKFACSLVTFSWSNKEIVFVFKIDTYRAVCHVGNISSFWDNLKFVKCVLHFMPVFPIGCLPLAHAMQAFSSFCLVPSHSPPASTSRSRSYSCSLFWTCLHPDLLQSWQNISTVLKLKSIDFFIYQESGLDIGPMWAWFQILLKNHWSLRSKCLLYCIGQKILNQAYVSILMSCSDR